MREQVIRSVGSMQNNVMPFLIGILAAALFGAATPTSKALLNSLSAFQLAGLLYIGATIGVIPLVSGKGHLSAPWKLPRKTCFKLLGAIFFGGCLGPVLLLLGLGLASSASVALWLNLELVTTVALGQLFFHDRLTKTSALAAAGTLAAAILLSVSEGLAGLYAGLLVLAACLCWGLDNHLTALIDRMSPSQTTFWKGLVAGPVNFTIGMYVTPFHPSVTVVGLALLVGALTYGISIVLYIASAQQLGATRSQIVFSSSPFLAFCYQPFSCEKLSHFFRDWLWSSLLHRWAPWFWKSISMSTCTPRSSMITGTGSTINIMTMKIPQESVWAGIGIGTSTTRWSTLMPTDPIFTTGMSTNMRTRATAFATFKRRAGVQMNPTPQFIHRSSLPTDRPVPSMQRFRLECNKPSRFLRGGDREQNC